MAAFTSKAACFCDLARRGSLPGASSGERACNRLAKALDQIGDDMMLLDPDVIEGFNSLCTLSGGPFASDDEKAVVFDTIAKAAGK